MLERVDGSFESEDAERDENSVLRTLNTYATESTPSFNVLSCGLCSAIDT